MTRSDCMEAAEPDYRAEMAHPEGVTCADCAHVRHCTGMYGIKPEDTACDFWPSRFRAAKLSDFRYRTACPSVSRQIEREEATKPFPEEWL